MNASTAIPVICSLFLLTLIVACAFVSKPVRYELDEIQAEEEAKK